MCGITGILYTDSSRPVERQVLHRMTDKLVHRGPDDSGIWTEGAVGLGHRRLSIIDIEGGHQPMSLEGDRLWITYNGEIYNYIELRAELEKRHQSFANHSDTEVLLQAYATYGEACLNHLNGMFAFAVWDRHNRSLFAARDRFGIKPFYYYWDGDVFLFASEIKSLLEHPQLEAEVDHRSLQDYLDLQYCLGDKTLFAGIKRLPPGHSLTLKDGQLRIARYWDMDFAPRTEISSQEDMAAELLDLLEDAVRLRLRSDVPVGSHLSGGLDSSAIAGIAAKLLDAPLHVFTGGFKENQKYDESRYARLVAEDIGAHYHEVFPVAQDLEDTFSHLVYMLDEPIAGAAVFPQYFVSKLAAENVKVVLGGQGGDEIFCGYTRYLIAYLETCLKKSVYGAADMVQGVELEDLLPNLPYLGGYEPTMEKLFTQDFFGAPADRYYRLLLRSQDMDSVLNVSSHSGNYSTKEAFRAEFMHPATDALIDRMAYMDIKNHLQSLLQLEDRTSMAVSLESRLPLLDYRIVEYAFSVAPALRFAGGKPKHLFRQAVGSFVPQAVMERQDKMGFPVPIYEWFNGELRPFVEDILLGATTRQRGIYNMDAVEGSIRSERPFGRTLWGLLSLELWFRTFFDGE
jgi:asparagine synthase (glutamine-hydrolysing)